MNSAKTNLAYILASIILLGVVSFTVSSQSEKIAAKRRYGSGEGEPGNVIPFIVKNKLDTNAKIIFGRLSLLTQRLEGNYYFRTGNHDSAVFLYPVQFLDIHNGVFFHSPQNSNRFTEIKLDRPIKDVKKIYRYPTDEIGRDKIIENLQKGIDEPGKILVYEMSETYGITTQ